MPPVRLTLLEHLNLNVPCEATARAFYVDGLGGVVNPRSTNSRQLHVNVGASQFHLPHRLSVRGMEPVEVAQVWAGHTELWTAEDLAALHSRLPKAKLVGAGDALHLCCEVHGQPRVLQLREAERRARRVPGRAARQQQCAEDVELERGGQRRQ